MWNFFNSRSASSLLAFVANRGPLVHQSKVKTISTVDRYFSSSALGMTAAPPKQFVLQYDYIADVLEKRPPYREKHLELAGNLCLAGGPTASLNENIPTGALFIFATLEAAEAFVKQDPYVSAGIVTGHTIKEWTVAIQN